MTTDDPHVNIPPSLPPSLPPSTVGYGDIVPHSDAGRLVTCLFMIFGVCIIAGVFAEMMQQIFLVHRDAALKEMLEKQIQQPDNTGNSASAAVDAMLERQISLKLWSALWMVMEMVVLIFFGVGIIYTVEDWNFPDTLYWAVQTAFAVGYGDFAPKTQSGRWVATVFMIIGCVRFNAYTQTPSLLPSIDSS